MKHEARTIVARSWIRSGLVAQHCSCAQPGWRFLAGSLPIRLEQGAASGELRSPEAAREPGESGGGSSSGPEGYEIAKLNANAKLVVFRNGMHGQFPAELPTREDTDYRICALRLARAFVADPQGRLDTSCADTRPLRLVR